MFRRSRLSIRPNVGTTGRTAATPQEAPPSNQESSEPPKDSSDSHPDTAGTDNKSAVVQSEQTPPAGDSNDQNGESTTSSAALQRRKRFSIKPKVAPGRPAAHPRTPKSPIKPVLQSHIEVPSSDLDKPTSSQVGTTAPPQVLLSPRHRRASEEIRQAKTQPKPTLTSSGSSETLSIPPVEDSVEQIHLRPDGDKKESSSASQVKEVSPRQPDKVPLSLPDKEAIEISEKAKTLVSSKRVISTSPSKFSLSRLLNDASDLQRLEKARKLRELLRQEIHKEKKLKRAKARVKEYTLDPAKMTMRDLIHYLPMSNPMTSSLQESVQENETVVPRSPVREESPEKAQEPQVHPKMMSPRQQGEEEEEEQEGEAAAEEDDEQEESLMVPQVKVAEDGSLIIDEESLTVEVQRMKGPNPVQDRDPIFERGSTTTYASFRKANYAKPWSSEETDMFFLAISMVGTDFTMICQLFPHRARSEIKNKFKKEERGNAWRIDKAFRERRRLDIEYFTKLLEKILEVQKNKKKLKSLSVKNKTPKKHIRKPKGKKAARKLSDVEEENEVDEEEEGEKENEELCNEGESPVSKPKRKCKRNDKEDASPEQPDSKINKRGKKEKKPAEASVPMDTEAALPEDHTTSDQCDAPKDIADIKPAKLSQGRVSKVPLPVSLKRSKKPPPSSTKSKENSSDKGENMSEEASAEQVSEDASPSRQTNERESADENIESDEESSIKPPRPTRYGRVPKRTQHLNYAAKEETHPSASETTPASPAGHAASAAKAKPKGAAKRGRSARQQAGKESKKPRLITLRASQSEDSDDEDDEPRAVEAIMGSVASCSSIDGSAAVFVPGSLCSPQPLVIEVEETMEELDILANMPDVLGISQDALCPEASCEQAQNEAGTTEPCEHQLDLLVDVIDFLSSEHTEVSEDESYNEAAQTLLTIGNVAHLSHPSQNQASMEDLPNMSVIANESSHQEESQSMSDVQQEISTCPVSVPSAHEIAEPSETVGTREPESSTTEEWPPSEIANTSVTSPCEETYCEQKTKTVSDPQSNPETSKKPSLQIKKGRFSKIKPKPNIARASRTTLSNSQTNDNTLSLRTAEDGHSSASDIFQVSHSQQVPETISELQNSGPTVTGEISCSDVRLTEEPSGHQEAVCSVIVEQSTSENQNSCIPETQFESSRQNQLTTEPTDEKLPPLDRTGDISYSSSLTSITVTGSASVCEGTDLVCVSAVNQKEQTEVTNTSDTRRGRSHETKSADNLLQASETEQPKTQTTQDPVTHLELVDKPSIQTANLQPTETPAKKMETEPTGNAGLPETPSQSTGPDSVSVSSVNMDSTHQTAQNLYVTEEKKTDVEFTSQADSCSESSEQNAPQRRRRFPKVKPKPNLGSSPRSTQSRAQLKCLSKSSNQLCKDSSSNATSEQQPIEENSAKTQLESAERDSHHLTPSHSSLNVELSSANAGNAESEKSLGSTNEKDAQSDSIVMATSWIAESKTMFTDSVSENKTNTRPPVEESTGGCLSNQDKVETLDTGAASLCNTEQEINSRTAESNTQPVGDPSTVSNVQHSHDVPVLTTKAESIPEYTQQPQSETHSDVQSQEAGHHSETNQANKDKCPSHETLSETQDVPADSSKTSRKPPQTQRGRFIKPKPNLGRSSRPQRPQSKTQNMTDSGICSDSADASDSQKAVSELRSDVQETVEGAKVQAGGLDVPPSDAQSSLGDLTQVHDSSAQSFQDATTSGTVETLNYQNLSIFQDILTEQVPSDPDEPFFVLSLTAIPVCPSGEVLDTVSEPYLPVTDALAQQESSGPGETVTAGSDGSFANTHVPTSIEASSETDLISGKDIGPVPAVSESFLTERPENPQEGTSAQPNPTLPDTTENTQESDDPPAKRRQTGRRAKLQVKPKTARNRQARNKETLAAKEANNPLQTNTTQGPEIPRPSVQPEVTDSTAKTWIEIISESEEESGDHLLTEKSDKAVEDRSSGAQSQTTESRGKRRTRKSKNVLPVVSDTNSTKEASDPPQVKPSARCSKVKAPCAGRRSPTPSAVASTSHDVAYSTVPEETHSAVSATPLPQIQMDVQQSEDHSQSLSDTTPSTSQCTDEVLSTQQSDWMEDSQMDDEPTSVSQYFLSDIFTDVEHE